MGGGNRGDSCQCCPALRDCILGRKSQTSCAFRGENLLGAQRLRRAALLAGAGSLKRPMRVQPGALLLSAMGKLCPAAFTAVLWWAAASRCQAHLWTTWLLVSFPGSRPAAFSCVTSIRWSVTSATACHGSCSGTGASYFRR